MLIGIICAVFISYIAINISESVIKYCIDKYERKH